MIKQINVRTIMDRRYLHNVDASVTPIEAFSMAGIEYDGTTAIIVGGHPISSAQAYGPISDIIKTDDFDGIVTIAAIAKHDNALEIKTIGNSVFVVSSATPQQIEDLNEWKPSALTYVEDGNLFYVCNGEGEGGISECGVEFAEGEIDGKAYVHMSIPEDMTMEEFKAEFKTLDIAHQLWILKQIEDGFELALKEIETRKNAILDCFS